MINNFPDLWKAHFEWNQGILVKEIKSLKTADIYLGNTPDEWFNFALPKVADPDGLDLEEIKDTLSLISPPTTVYLLETQIESGFPEFLRQNNYELMGKDTWLVFNQKTDSNLKTEVKIEKVGLDKFSDYQKVTEEAFKEEGFDDRPYNEVCRKTLTGEMKSKNPGFSSDFLMIYIDGRPAAGAGLFTTDGMACFHNDATIKEFRRRGYHTNLIKNRINYCLNKGIKIIYTLVEHGSQSFRNFSRLGFETWQTAQMFTLKK